MVSNSASAVVGADDMALDTSAAAISLISAAGERWREQEGTYRDDITALIMRLPLSAAPHTMGTFAAAGATSRPGRQPSGTAGRSHASRASAPTPSTSSSAASSGTEGVRVSLLEAGSREKGPRGRAAIATSAQDPKPRGTGPSVKRGGSRALDPTIPADVSAPGPFAKAGEDGDQQPPLPEGSPGIKGLSDRRKSRLTVS